MVDLSRRGLLGSLATVPALTLPAIALSVPPAMAAPAVPSIEDRAKLAYAAFAATMTEMAAAQGLGGWIITTGNRFPFHHYEGGPFCLPWFVRYEWGTEPRCPNLIVERSVDLPFKLR